MGPRLARVIVLLALRMRLSRASIRELLMEMFEVTVSTGVIDETIREAGRASLPLENALQDGFAGLLISDGYGVYRAKKSRLRCWPHLMRKLRRLAESSEARVSGVGHKRWKAS